jgi:MYXO-CTERM domain-containing protein
MPFWHGWLNHFVRMSPTARTKRDNAARNYMDRVLHSRAPVRALLLSLPCLWALGVASPAQAQQTILTTDVLSIGGVPNTAANAATLYINAEACADPDSTLVVQVNGLGAFMNPTVGVWVGNNCNTNRADSGTTSSDCVPIHSQPLAGESELDVEVPIGMLSGCEGTATVNVWFMPMANATSDTEVITAYGLETFTVDTLPPATPTNVSGGSGETQISVDWDSSGGDIQNYYVYWDTAIGGGDNDAGSGECATANLYAGAELDPGETPPGVGKEKTASNATSHDLDGASIDGDMAGVAVQAVDLAGNVSELSETACIDVVPTNGFWDLYKANGGDAKEGCACSLPGRPETSRTPWLGGLLLLALVALRARRRA